MNYTIASDLEVCGKFKGDSIAEKELVDAGANIEALIEAGHITAVLGATKSTPTIKEGDE